MSKTLKVHNIIESRKRQREYFLRQSLQQVGLSQDSQVEDDSEPGQKFSENDRLFIELATGIVVRNISDSEFGVDELCQEMAMSRTLFFSRLKSLTGKAPQEFIRLIRLQNAAERKGNNIYSGRVNSQGKMNFRTGRIEASIKLPKTANGLWPAFWMMGDNGKNWPTCGEIDILEMGEKQGILNGTSESLVNVAIHYGEDYTSHRQEYFAKLLDHSLQDGEYHIYALEKTANRLTITIDGIEIRSFDISPVSGRQEYFKDEYYALIRYIAILFSFGQEAYSDYRGNSMSQLFFGNDPANNPSYLCSTFFNAMYDNGDPRTFRIARAYYDGLMSATSPDNRIDLTQEMLDLIQAQDGFLCVGHGYYVDRVTLD